MGAEDRPIPSAMKSVARLRLAHDFKSDLGHLMSGEQAARPTVDMTPFFCEESIPKDNKTTSAEFLSHRRMLLDSIKKIRLAAENMSVLLSDSTLNRNEFEEYQLMVRLANEMPICNQTRGMAIDYKTILNPT